MYAFCHCQKMLMETVRGFHKQTLSFVWSAIKDTQLFEENVSREMIYAPTILNLKKNVSHAMLDIT